MTNIVDRLREPAGQFGKSMVLCNEAADQIEQLQQDRAHLLLKSEGLEAAILNAAERNNRLIAALTNIEDYCDEDGLHAVERLRKVRGAASGVLGPHTAGKETVR